MMFSNFRYLISSAARAVEPFLDENAYEWREGLGKFANNWHDGDSQAREGNHSYKMESKSYSKEDFISSCTSMLDLKDYADTTRDFSKFLQGHNVTEESSSAEHSDRTTSEINWLRLDLPFRSCKSDNKHESRENQLGRKDWKQFNFPKQPYRRSRSAPPFYRQKTRFISLRHHSMMKEGNVQLFHDDLTSPGTLSYVELYVGQKRIN